MSIIVRSKKICISEEFQYRSLLVEVMSMKQLTRPPFIPAHWWYSGTSYDCKQSSCLPFSDSETNLPATLSH